MSEGIGFINIGGGSTLLGDTGINLLAADKSATKIHAYGLNISGAAAANLLFSDADNKSNTQITIDEGNTIVAGNGLAGTGTVKINAEKENTVETKTMAGSAGIGFAGTGIVATAKDSGEANITIGNSNTIEAKDSIQIGSANSPSVTAETGAIAASIVASAAITKGSAVADSKATLNIGSGNQFKSQQIDLGVEVDGTAATDIKSLSGSYLGALAVNKAIAENNTQAIVDIGNNTYGYRSTSKDEDDILADVNIVANNNTKQTAKASGLNFAGLYASGSNVAETSANDITEVIVGGGSGAINNLNIKANGTVNNSAEANGDGGAAIDLSPVAAKVKNEINSVTTANLNGSWNVAGDLNVEALHKNTAILNGNATKATAIGLSAVEADSEITNQTTVNIKENSMITSKGSLNVKALNSIGYGKSNDDFYTLNGGGYGGITTNGASSLNKINLQAGINVGTGSNMTADGSLKLIAGTEGSIYNRTNVNSAGVVAGTSSTNINNITYKNNVTLGENTKLKTTKQDQDILISANDNTTVVLKSTANTQGGVIGAATAELKNTINRSNTIGIGTGADIESTNDVKIYAGSGEDGFGSTLNLTTIANAYNKTAAPISTNPTVKNIMQQNNQAILSGDIKSVRHIDVQAQKGNTMLVKGANYYKWTTGSGGSGELASTVLGDSIADETTNNYVQINGANLTAGIHNKANITIDSASGEKKSILELIQGDAEYQAKQKAVEDAQNVYQTDSVNYNTALNAYNDAQTAHTNAVTEVTVAQTALATKKANPPGESAAEAEKQAYDAEVAKLEKAVLDKQGAEQTANTTLGTKTKAYNDAKDTFTHSSLDLDNKYQAFTAICDTLYEKVASETALGDNYKITKPDWLSGSVTPSKYNYANQLKARYDEVSNMLLEYPATSSVYANYRAEQQRLAKEMVDLGFVDQADIGSDGKIHAVLKEVTVGALEIPDLVVSGGNIAIHADQVKGSGNIKAQGAPEINIKNNTDLYLKVNNITIAAEGGKVQYNDQNITQASDLGSGFSGTVKNDAVDGNVPQITIENTFNAAASTNQNSSIMPDIGIYGKITNTLGNVVIKNTTYNIAIMGSGSISAKNIQLIAEKGAVSQGYTDGLVNVGTDPIAKMQNDKENNQNKADDSISKGSLTGQISNDVDVTVDKNDQNGIYAGDNIYINAANVNLHGNVQSGYAEYTLNLDTDKVKTQIDTFDKNYQGGKITDLSNYKLNDGGRKYNNTTQAQYYEVQAYYNPETKQIVLEDIVPKGGQIYITGAVSATGSGSTLTALDGVANINLNLSDLQRDVKLNAVKNSYIQGLISITDTNKGIVTEYRRDSQSSYTIGASADSAIVKTNSGIYNPESGLWFQWTNGKNYTETQKKEYTKDFIFWGGIKYNTTDDFITQIDQSKVSSHDMHTSGGVKMGDGFVIAKNDAIQGDSNNYVCDYENSSTGQISRTDVVQNKHYDGLKGKIFGFGEIIYSWAETQGRVTTYNHSLKADNPINVKFIGSETSNNLSDKGNINIKTQGNILLNGTLSSAEKDNQAIGKINLTSNNGAIKSLSDAGKIIGDNIVLNAATGIDVYHNTIGQTATISAVTQAGDININSSASKIGGNLNIDAITQNGNVSIQTQGNIEGNKGTSPSIQGNRIDLISTHGSIGTNDAPLVIQAGTILNSTDSLASSINASAHNGNIALTQATGDMRIGKVEASGDAVLTVKNGNFVDALPSSDDTASVSVNDKIAEWKALGLVGEKADATNGAQVKQEKINDLESQAHQLYLGQTDADTKIQGLKGIANEFAQDNGIKDAKALLSGAKTTDEQSTAQAAYSQAKERFFASKACDKKEQGWVESWENVNQSEAYGWTQNQLLYAIQDSVINAEPGHISTVANTNISAKNVTLKALNGGIGIDEGAKTINYNNLNDVGNLKVLAQAKAGDLEWKDDQVVVTRKLPISIVLNGGSLNAEAKSNIYLAGTEEKPVYVDNIQTNGNIRLLGTNGVYSVDHVSNNTNLSGNDLVLEAGKGSIGTDSNYIKTSVKGSLDANAGGSIYLQQLGSALNVQSLAAGQDITLDAAKGIFSVNSDDPAKNLGYINAKDTITLKSLEGGIGQEDTGLRILSNGSVLSIEAQDDIFLDAKTRNVDGTIVLGNIDTTKGVEVAIEAEGNVSLGKAAQEATEDAPAAAAVEGSIAENSNVKNVTIIANGSVELNGGIKTNTNDGTISLTAKTGSIYQADTAGASITAKNLNTMAAGEQNYQNKDNLFSNVDVLGTGTENITGGITLKTSADQQLNLNLNDVTVNTGNVIVENDSDAAINLSKGATIHGNAKDKGSLILKTNQGDIINNGTFSADGDISITSQGGNIENNASIYAGAGAEVKTNSGDIHIKDLNASGNVNIYTGKGNIRSEGEIKSSEADVSVITEEGKNTLHDVYAQKLATVGSNKGNVYLDYINGENVRVIANDIDNGLYTGKVIAGKSYMVSGNSVDVGELEQRAGYENMLVFKPKGVGNGPMEMMRLGNVKVNSGYGLMIDNLWAKRAEVNLEADKFYIPEVKIIDVGHFKTNGAKVTLSGTKAIRESNGVELFFDANDPGWMQLYLLGDKKVFMDGTLLRKEDHYIVYNEEFSGSDLAGQSLFGNLTSARKTQEGQDLMRFMQGGLLAETRKVNNFSNLIKWDSLLPNSSVGGSIRQRLTQDGEGSIQITNSETI